MFWRNFREDGFFLPPNDPFVRQSKLKGTPGIQKTGLLGLHIGTAVKTIRFPNLEKMFLFFTPKKVILLIYEFVYDIRIFWRGSRPDPPELNGIGLRGSVAKIPYKELECYASFFLIRICYRPTQHNIKLLPPNT